MNLLIVETALFDYGLSAIPGNANEPEIMKMALACNFADYTNDGIAWCSLAMNYWALKAGYQRSNSLAARSWLSCGSIVATPELGDVVVYWREAPAGPYGHVGLWIAARNGVIYTLGGNENNSVEIAGFDPGKILGYRRLIVTS